MDESVAAVDGSAAAAVGESVAAVDGSAAAAVDESVAAVGESAAAPVDGSAAAEDESVAAAQDKEVHLDTVVEDTIIEKKKQKRRNGIDTKITVDELAVVALGEAVAAEESHVEPPESEVLQYQIEIKRLKAELSGVHHAELDRLKAESLASKIAAEEAYAESAATDEVRKGSAAVGRAVRSSKPVLCLDLDGTLLDAGDLLAYHCLTCSLLSLLLLANNASHDGCYHTWRNTEY